MEELLERQVFEEYKNKILTGVIDEVKVVCHFLRRKNQILFGAKTKFLPIITPVWVRPT